MRWLGFGGQLYFERETPLGAAVFVVTSGTQNEVHALCRQSGDPLTEPLEVASSAVAHVSEAVVAFPSAGSIVIDDVADPAPWITDIPGTLVPMQSPGPTIVVRDGRDLVLIEVSHPQRSWTEARRWPIAHQVPDERLNKYSSGFWTSDGPALLYNYELPWYSRIIVGDSIARMSRNAFRMTETKSVFVNYRR